MTTPWDARFETVLRERLPSLADEPIRPDTPLQDAGLNSMKITALLVALEDAYGGTAADDELTFEAFATPEALWNFVSRALPVDSAR